jgi:D-sedoheptulose 7-phosphate isomerase
VNGNYQLEHILTSYIRGSIGAIQRLSVAELEKVVIRLEEARWKGQRVFTCGNGGSATTAMHFAADLQKGAWASGKLVIDSECLCDNIARFSAWANDTTYEEAFVGAMKSKVKDDSVLIAISGSGNSPNILNAVIAARDVGATTIGLTGFDGGRLRNLCDICVIVSSDSMEQIEDAHMLICHLITNCLRVAEVEQIASLK